MPDPPTWRTNRSCGPRLPLTAAATCRDVEIGPRCGLCVEPLLHRDGQCTPVRTGWLSSSRGLTCHDVSPVVLVKLAQCVLDILQAEWSTKEGRKLNAKSEKATLRPCVRCQVPHQPGQVQAVPAEDPAQASLGAWTQASPLVVGALAQDPRLQQVAEHLPGEETSYIGDGLEHFLDLFQTPLLCRLHRDSRPWRPIPKMAFNLSLQICLYYPRPPLPLPSHYRPLR